MRGDTPAHRVAILAVPPVKAFDVAMPQMVLGAAVREGRALYEVRVCTADPGIPQDGGGLTLGFEHGLEALSWADSVVIAGTEAREIDSRVLAAVRGAVEAGKRVAAICTGGFVLAGTGLLDGRAATTYWLHTTEFQISFPRVDLRRDVLFVEDGTLLTSAGAAAGIDLCLHLVRSDFGAAVATEVARAAVVGPFRPGGQPQIVATPLPAARDVSLAATRAWALARLDTPLTLADLAAHSRTSVRTFTRRFRAETGGTPQRWLLDQRLHRARQLLETTDLPLARIARDCGLGTPDSLRRHLVRHVGRTPSAYRALAAEKPRDRPK
ncbi:GlxA family transcriptional regulator [Actinocorallia longicatena]|uniref:Helix-turn-helix domain-containing protein n=1 Tax=Actinocorallia longicatena TaxID=111803 RepID=A0ABP6Q7K2_9ACTN